MDINMVIKTYEPLVLKLVSQYQKYFKHGVYPGDHDDLMSEGRIAVWKAATTYRAGNVQFKTYVFSCVKNRFLDLQKLAYGKGKPRYEEWPDMLDVPYDSNLQKLIENQELINILSQEERDLVLFFFSGGTFHELWRAVKIDKSILQKEVHQCLTRIQRKLKSNASVF